MKMCQWCYNISSYVFRKKSFTLSTEMRKKIKGSLLIQTPPLKCVSLCFMKPLLGKYLNSAHNYDGRCSCRLYTHDKNKKHFHSWGNGIGLQSYGNVFFSDFHHFCLSWTWLYAAMFCRVSGMWWSLSYSWCWLSQSACSSLDLPSLRVHQISSLRTLRAS